MIAIHIKMVNYCDLSFEGATLPIDEKIKIALFLVSIYYSNSFAFEFLVSRRSSYIFYAICHGFSLGLQGSTLILYGKRPQNACCCCCSVCYACYLIELQSLGEVPKRPRN